MILSIAVALDSDHCHIMYKSLNYETDEIGDALSTTCGIPNSTTT
jgi:hypothetical protein